MNTRILAMIFSVAVISACGGSEEADLSDGSGCDGSAENACNGSGEVDAADPIDDMEDDTPDDPEPDAEPEVPFSFEDFENRCLGEYSDECLYEYIEYCIPNNPVLVNEDVCANFFIIHCDDLPSDIDRITCSVGDGAIPCYNYQEYRGYNSLCPDTSDGSGEGSGDGSGQ